MNCEIPQICLKSVDAFIEVKHTDRFVSESEVGDDVNSIAVSIFEVILVDFDKY